MNTSWLFGQSLKRNKSRLLPQSVITHPISLPVKPSLICGFGVGNSIEIDNSATGSPYDLEYTTPILVAFKFNFKSFVGANTISYPFYKYVGGKGYIFDFRNPSGNTFDVRYGLYYGTSSSIYRMRTGLDFNTEYIVIAGTTSAGNVDVVRVYNSSGTYLAALGVLSGGSVPSTTIKNAAQLISGTNFIGYLGQYSLWNTTMTDAQKDELALKIVQDKVKEHSLYASNCLGYWREFLPGKVLNEIDQTYNGTYSGFQNP